MNFRYSKKDKDNLALSYPQNLKTRFLRNREVYFHGAQDMILYQPIQSGRLR